MNDLAHAYGVQPVATWTQPRRLEFGQPQWVRFI